jgi:hypothetical protein
MWEGGWEGGREWQERQREGTVREKRMDEAMKEKE